MELREDGIQGLEKVPSTWARVQQNIYNHQIRRGKQGIQESGEEAKQVVIWYDLQTPSCLEVPMNDVIEFLKKYILKNGFAKLSEDPFGVYEAMVKGYKGKQGIDVRNARLVLMALMSKTHEMAGKGCSADELISHIQSEHFVNKKTAKDLAAVFLAVFSDENRKIWSDATEAGFQEFCKEEWTIEWDGRCDWHTKHGGSYPCRAEASLTITVGDKDKLHSHLSVELKSNPFLAADDIYGILVKQVEADLDKDMDEYCNADDYYEPYLEEFVGEGTYESEKKWKSWGLEIVEFTGTGDIDFEP